MVALSISISANFGLTWPHWKRFVAQIEALGFAGLFRSDHFTLPDAIDLDSLEMIVSLTYLADHSERVHFGPLVAPLSFRDPVMLDDLSIARRLTTYELHAMPEQPTPPRHIIAPFLDLLARYDLLRAQLYDALEPQLTLQPPLHAVTSFTPTERTIAQQILHWPEGQFLYPPVAWVEPRKGQIEVQGVIWTYAFHGAGLTFAHTVSALDVSVEFARTGAAAITEWTFRCHVESKEAETFVAVEIIPFLDLLFEYAVEQQILLPVAPILEGDDQTYVLIASRKNTPS